MPSVPSPALQLPGLHHVTAICGDPRRNVAFYSDALGLRFIKQTVNFDDPTTYHLYYGNDGATPGSAMTFFPWMQLRRGRPGTGQAYATAFSVPAGSLEFWSARLRTHGVDVVGPVDRFGESVLAFTDPDGLGLELVATSAPDTRPPAVHPDIPAAHAIRGFHSVTLALADAAPTQALFTATMGWRVAANDGLRTRLVAADGGPGSIVDLLVDPRLPRGLSGGGTVHHVAFRTPDDATQVAARRALAAAGRNVSPVIDRNYFHSIYYPEPGGVLFEIATDGPGFAVDEPLETLGQKLQLPPQYEPHRAEIVAALPPLK